MTKFASRCATPGVIAKVGTIGIPLAHGGGAREYRLFRCDQNSASKHRNAGTLTRRWVVQRFLPEHRWRIGTRSQCAHATSNAIEMKLLNLSENRITGARIATLNHVERILTDPTRLVCVARQRHELVGSRIEHHSRSAEPRRTSRLLCRSARSTYNAP